MSSGDQRLKKERNHIIKRSFVSYLAGVFSTCCDSATKSSCDMYSLFLYSS